MILTVLGGSAQSTPVLVRSLSGAFGSDPVVIRLAGRHPERLRAVGHACRVLAAAHIYIEEYNWCNWTHAVRGSHAVLVQVRPGGYEGRAFDEAFPLRHGVPGDEGLGPGGLSAAWRCWPVVRDILHGVRTNSPGAAIVLLTSPGSLLVRLASGELPDMDVIGVCELPWTTLCTICGNAESALGASFDYHGVNHMGWLYNVRLNGRNMLDQSGTDFPSTDLIRRLGAWPLKYLRLHYYMDEVVADQRRAPAARVKQLAAIADRAFKVFTCGSRAEIEETLSARPAEWYQDAVVPLLRAMLGEHVEVPLFLTIGGEGELQERCYRADGGRLVVQQPSAPPPPEVANTAARFVQYEQVAGSAIAQNSEDLAVDALALHPWIRSRDTAARLARSVFSQTEGECVGLPLR